MAITTPTLVGAGSFPIERIAPWAVNNSEDDANPAVEMKAAPGAGKALYLTHVTMSIQFSGISDSKVTLKDEDGTVLFGPITLQSNGEGNYTKDWRDPLKLADNKGLYVYAPDYDMFTCYVEGFTGDKPLG